MRSISFLTMMTAMLAQHALASPDETLEAAARELNVTIREHPTTQELPSEWPVDPNWHALYVGNDGITIVSPHRPHFRDFSRQILAKSEIVFLEIGQL